MVNDWEQQSSPPDQLPSIKGEELKGKGEPRAGGTVCVCVCVLGGGGGGGGGGERRQGLR